MSHTVPGWRPKVIAVCVPVRNEQQLLPALLQALATQQGAPLDRVVACFLFDECDDGSAQIVSEAAAGLPYRVASASTAFGGPPNAGRARRAALALGQQHVAGCSDAALLTTDADSAPAPDWIAATCRSLAQADVVAGRIIRAPDHETGQDDSPQDRIESYFDRLYALRRAIDPVSWEDAPAHHYTGGASLAFRADAYAALGGFPACPAGEDAAIVDAAHLAGLRVRRDRAVTVHTSSRRDGRAPDGLAHHLRRLEGSRSVAAVRVGHPSDVSWRYHGHASARAGFADIPCIDRMRALAERLAIDPADIGRVAAGSPNAEAFAMRVVPAIPGGERMVPLAEAEYVLAALEGGSREQAA